MTDYPESHLVRLAIEGNGEAFGVLVQRHSIAQTLYRVRQRLRRSLLLTIDSWN